MTLHKAVFRFGVGSLDVAADALGRQWPLERDGVTMLLSLPSRPDSFGKHETAASVAVRESGDKETAFDEGRVVIAGIHLVQVAVDVEAAVYSTDPGEDERKSGQAAVDAAFPLALDVAIDFIGWLRVSAGATGWG